MFVRAPQWTPFAAAILATCLLITGCAKYSSQYSIQDADEADQEEVMRVNEFDTEQTEKIRSLGFEEPLVSERTRAIVREKFSAVDPNHIVPSNLLETALAYFDANLAKIRNQHYLTIVDFASFSGAARMYVINISTGAVWTGWVAHGSGSDRNNDGYADSFSNQSGSNASSLGFYLGSETYSGKHGLSLKLDGLSPTNSNARARAVVLHGAAYVNRTPSRQGRSWGCLAVPMSDRNFLVGALKEGSLIYAGLSR